MTSFGALFGGDRIWGQRKNSGEQLLIILIIIWHTHHTRQQKIKIC